MAPKGVDPRVLPGGGPTGGGLLRAVLVGCAVGLVLGSHPLALWAERLPEWASPVRAGAVAWDGAMAGAGLAAPYRAVHRWARVVSGDG